MSHSSNSNRQQLSQYLLRQNEPKQHQYSGSSPVYILSPSGGAGAEQQKPQYRSNYMNESRENYQSREYRSMPESTAPGRSVEQQNSAGSQQSSMMIHMQYQNTMQFEQVLKRALELQESLGLNSLIHANVPPSYISKTTRVISLFITPIDFQRSCRDLDSADELPQGERLPDSCWRQQSQ
ncbi:hypothetical protein FGO68_gene6517 [Halteria grandinella]|uniref:Uncharacterized protein n=1 Tax=Halteria grandinella TaxID=5974 RepID=A0A8J8NEW8_HALGN|nr:hypothetical protein FGO68_gene6517 [Halteria grandinella]